MNILFLIAIALFIAVVIFAQVMVMHVMFGQKKQIDRLNYIINTMAHHIGPMRLHFLQMVYNDCVKNENYREAGKILTIINEEFPGTNNINNQ